MVIIPFHPHLLSEVHELFDLCNSGVAKGWTFNPNRTLIALKDDKVVGFLACWRDGQPIAWVDMLLVHPDYRNQRVGATLCYTLEALLKSEGVSVIRCVIDEGNDLAAPLTKAGFSTVGTFTIMEKHYEAQGS